jgi:hypothetical protein
MRFRNLLGCAQQTVVFTTQEDDCALKAQPRQMSG